MEYFVCASPFESKTHHFGFNRTKPNRYLGLLKNNLDFPRIEFYAFHLLSIGLNIFFSHFYQIIIPWENQIRFRCEYSSPGKESDTLNEYLFECDMWPESTNELLWTQETELFRCDWLEIQCMHLYGSRTYWIIVFMTLSNCLHLHIKRFQMRVVISIE